MDHIVSKNDLNPDNANQAAKLAVIGGVITTLGDAISTMAAVLALEEVSQEKKIIMKLQI